MLNKDSYRVIRQTATEIRVNNTTPAKFFKNKQSKFRYLVENEYKAQLLEEKAKYIRQCMLLAEVA